jgi:tubulin polyglutamylase TTLL9
MKFNNSINSKIFIIHNGDQIVAKDYLWKNLIDYYGLKYCLNIMPMTYLLNNNNDLTKLENDFNKNNIYILKKNIQRQEGLKISNNLSEIINNKNEYVIVQELLQDPYLINGRKINLRVYVLVVCYKNNYTVYVYNDGFMYYTKELFKAKSLDFNSNITTGYIARWIYDVNPLTHTDFKKYLDNSNRLLISSEKNLKNNNVILSTHVFNNIYKLITDVFTAFYKKIGNSSINDKLYNVTSFQLFGVDVAIDTNLNAKIIEVNKGPDLNSKDERDGKLKIQLIKDMFNIINILPNNNNNNKFIKIINLEN